MGSCPCARITWRVKVRKRDASIVTLQILFLIADIMLNGFMKSG